MRLILDTNVFVSALIQKSYPFFIVDRLLADGNLELCTSEAVVSEYLDVLNREKFSRFPDFHAKAQSLLADIESRSLKFNPTIKLKIIRDASDNKWLELAETCNAAYLVTGNTNDFDIPEYKGTKIVSPKDFFEIINQ